MLFNSFLILFLTKIICFVDSRNYTGHAVYKIYAKDLIKSHTRSYLDEDTAILLANGSIPLPNGSNKLWQGIERNGDEYAVVHVEPSKKRRFKRDLNYHLLTDDLNSWITGNHYRDNNQPIIVPLDNFPLLKMQPYNDGYLTAASKLEPVSESKLFHSYLAPNYDGSFWSLLLQSPLKTLAQLTSWNSPFSAGNTWSFMPVLSPSTSPLLAANQPPATTNAAFDSPSSPQGSSQSSPHNPSHSSPHNSPNNNPNKNTQTANYKASASTNAVKHAAAQEEAPVYLSAFVSNFRLDAYHNLDEIYEYLDRLAAIHKQLRVYTIGYSHENRPIKAIEIHQDSANLNKKLVYLDGLIHAREHITAAALLNIIEQILIRKIDCNFLIVPVINVDGYVYTWTTDRLWRKNRRKTAPNNNSFLHSLRTRFASERCNGVDLNRNWDSNFGGVGSSLNPCSELYAGPNAFSEPETSALARLLWDNRHRIRLFISLHSFGQLWAAPHSYTRARSPHHDLHMSLLKEVQQAVYSVNNVLYNVGPLGSSLYLGSGYSLDYCYQKLDIVHSYLVEVRDKGEFGFLLPQDQILPTSFEILEGILVSIKRAY